MNKMKKFIKRLEGSKQGFLARSEVAGGSRGENQTNLKIDLHSHMIEPIMDSLALLKIDRVRLD